MPQEDFIKYQSQMEVAIRKVKYTKKTKLEGVWSMFKQKGGKWK